MRECCVRVQSTSTMSRASRTLAYACECYELYSLSFALAACHITSTGGMAHAQCNSEKDICIFGTSDLAG